MKERNDVGVSLFFSGLPTSSLASCWMADLPRVLLHLPSLLIQTLNLFLILAQKLNLGQVGLSSLPKFSVLVTGP